MVQPKKPGLKLGIDVGGTAIKTILFDGTVRRSSVVRTPSNKKDFLKVLKHIISVFYDPALQGIGIGLPGIIDLSSGRIIKLPNLVGLNELNILKFLHQFHRNVCIDNDSKCILRAEATLGAARGKKNVVLVALGTGIGGGIMVDRKIYYGSGSAGEIGHTILDAGKTFEELAAGKTLKKFNAAEFKRIGTAVGWQLANITNLFDPDLIVLSGGLTEKHLRDWLPLAKKTMSVYILDPRAKAVKIAVGQLGEFAGAIGAALLVS